MSKWQPIETAPVGKNILAAAKVENNKTGTCWWDIHVICVDSETGETVRCIELHSLQSGGSVDDYTYWMPLPKSPAS